jgi:2-succinyl-5-enolpyruvyl-6-hydroxy-3-cyclohexene-1-carboxylate synthase
VCTADRPPELHHVGAPQVIDQERLFGSAVRWFVAPGVADHPGRPAWRSVAARAVAEASEGPLGPGPVHLNLAFREPLSAPPAAPEPASSGHAAHRVHRASAPGSASPPGAEIVEGWAKATGTKGIIVAGAGCGAPADVLELADLLGWPVLADPRSGCRLQGPAARGVIAAADSFLRSPEVADGLRPGAVLLLGASWSSKVLNRFIAGAAQGEPGARVIAVDPWWQWRDPDRIVGDVVAADPSWWVRAVADRLQAAGIAPARRENGAGWLAQWQRVEAEAQRAIDAALASCDDGSSALTEPAVARMILGAVPAGTTVVVSSSMPVRDLEWFSPPLAEPPVVLANRGANGIDGVCSTTLGVAAAGQGPVVGLLGDLAFLHDVSALVRSEGATGTAAPCTLVVLDNRGGGIFSFLPQAEDRDTARFEQLFGTPQAVSVPAVAAGFGLPVAEARTAAELRHALQAPPEAAVRVVWVPLPDRACNVAVHEEINDAVGAAARAAVGAASAGQTPNP